MSRMFMRASSCTILMAAITCSLTTSAQASEGDGKSRGGGPPVGVVKKNVIISLEYPDWVPEATLSERAARDQRTAIASLQSQLQSTLNVVGAVGVRNFITIPAVGARIQLFRINQLAADPLVRHVQISRPFEFSLDSSTRQIEADAVWNTPGYGYTGQGTTIAVIDTGIHPDHQDFGGRILRQGCFSYDVDPSNPDDLRNTCPPQSDPNTDFPPATDPCIHTTDYQGSDYCGHGTRVAAIAAGRHGVAPDAKIVAAQVTSWLLGDDGNHHLQTEELHLARALDWVNSIRDDVPNLVAVNLSVGIRDHLGSLGPNQYCDGFYDHSTGDDSTLNQAIDSLIAAGISIVAAAGNNDGPGLDAPACYREVISVGSVGDTNVFSSISSGAGFNSNYSTNLDILAPGEDVVTASLNPNNYHDDTFHETFKGTSASTPHVTGAIALLAQANGNHTPRDRRELLRSAGGEATYTFTQPNMSCTPYLRIGPAIAALAPPGAGPIGGFLKPADGDNYPFNNIPLEGWTVDRNGVASHDFTIGANPADVTITTDRVHPGIEQSCFDTNTNDLNPAYNRYWEGSLDGDSWEVGHGTFALTDVPRDTAANAGLFEVTFDVNGLVVEALLDEPHVVMGNTHTIRISKAPEVGLVTVELHAGGSVETLVANFNGSEYSWTVSNRPNRIENAHLYVFDVEDPSINDSSDPFTIEEVPEISNIVVSPTRVTNGHRLWVTWNLEGYPIPDKDAWTYELFDNGSPVRGLVIPISDRSNRHFVWELEHDQPTFTEHATIRFVGHDEFGAQIVEATTPEFTIYSENPTAAFNWHSPIPRYLHRTSTIEVWAEDDNGINLGAGVDGVGLELFLWQAPISIANGNITSIEWIPKDTMPISNRIVKATGPLDPPGGYVDGWRIVLNVSETGFPEPGYMLIGKVRDIGGNETEFDFPIAWAISE
jgi:hypothetical protein